MTIFFLLVGLEIERELYIGELSSVKNAALPALAAVGGMLVPALIHFLFNHGKPEQAGNRHSNGYGYCIFIGSLIADWQTNSSVP